MLHMALLSAVAWTPQTERQGLLRVNHVLWAVELAGGALYLDADEAALLFLHPLAVLVPVRVLAGQAAVVVDQELHRLGERGDLGRPINLDPSTEERVSHRAQRCARVEPQVAYLRPRLG